MRSLLLCIFVLIAHAWDDGYPHAEEGHYHHEEYDHEFVFVQHRLFDDDVSSSADDDISSADDSPPSSGTSSTLNLTSRSLSTPTTTIAPTIAPTSTIATATAPTTPIGPPLNLTSFVVAVVEGLETLGPVRVLVNAMPLGEPSFVAETRFEPFEGVQILVPAGAWLPPARRGGGNGLVLSIFEPSSEDGGSRGLALDLGPHSQRLGKPISFSIPLAPPSNHSEGLGIYALNLTSGTWLLDPPVFNNISGGQQLWAQSQQMGVHAVRLLAPPISNNTSVVTAPKHPENSEGLSPGAIAACVIAGLSALAIIGGLVWCSIPQRPIHNIEEGCCPPIRVSGAQLSFLVAA